MVLSGSIETIMLSLKLILHLRVSAVQVCSEILNNVFSNQFTFALVENVHFINLKILELELAGFRCISCSFCGVIDEEMNRLPRIVSLNPKRINFFYILFM